MRYNPRKVVVLPAAVDELLALPLRERQSLSTAIEKLRLGGETLGYPDSSSVQGSDEMLRELRPRSGRSAWRAFYRRIGDEMVIAAIGPEALHDPRGFRRSVNAAQRRLAAYRSEGNDE